MCKSNLGILNMRNVLVFLMLWIFSVTAFAQSVVKGVVKDETGEPMIGVTVTVKNTTTGTITGLDGSFSVDVKTKEATLTFTYVGFE